MHDLFCTNIDYGYIFISEQCQGLWFHSWNQTRALTFTFPRWPWNRGTSIVGNNKATSHRKWLTADHLKCVTASQHCFPYKSLWHVHSSVKLRHEENIVPRLAYMAFVCVQGWNLGTEKVSHSRTVYQPAAPAPTLTPLLLCTLPHRHLCGLFLPFKYHIPPCTCPCTALSGRADGLTTSQQGHNGSIQTK